MDKLRIAGGIIQTIGIALVWWEVGWIPAIGIVMAIWGNNIDFGLRAAPWKH